MLEALAALLGVAAGARSAGEAEGAAVRMPPYVPLVRWPGGLEIVRVLDLDFFWEQVDGTLGSKCGEEIFSTTQGLQPFEDGETAIFMVGVTDRGSFRALVCLVLKKTQTKSGIKHQLIELCTSRDQPFLAPDYAYLHSGRTGLDPLEPKIVWFLLDILDHGNPRRGASPGHPWTRDRLRLRLPAPVPDRLLLPSTYLEHTRFASAILAWQKIASEVAPPVSERDARDIYRARYLAAVEAVQRTAHGLLRYGMDMRLFSAVNPTHRTKFRTEWTVELDGQIFVLTLLFKHSSRQGPEVRWDVRWHPEIEPRRRRIVDLDPVEDERDLLTVLQAHRLVWPKSTYEAMLDDWLEPGEELFQVSPMFTALAAGSPYLLPPDAFWQWVSAMLRGGA